MFDIIWDIFQQTEIRNAQSNADSALKQTLKSKHDQLELETRHEQLKLVTLAIWELLKSHTGLKNEDLIRYISEVDLKDGQLDGKVSSVKKLTICDECNRKVLNTSPKCLFCGAKNYNYYPVDIV